jgi:hypothetical protein
LRVGFHCFAVLPDKADQPPEMVAMRMAQDQPVELLGIDPEQIEIAQEDFRRVAEIEQILTLAGVVLAFKMKRQPPFAGNR